MIGYIRVTSLSHSRKLFTKSFRKDKFFCISLTSKFYFSSFESLKIFVDIKFNGTKTMRYIVASFFEEMIFYLESQLIKFFLADIYFYLFSNESMSFFSGNLICISDMSDSDAFSCTRIIKISLDDILMGKLFYIHGYRFYQKFSFNFRCHY